jgi:hypothetical protein
MVDERYMLDKPRRPSRAKRYLHQVVIPRMIDAAAMLESGLEQASVCTRRSPVAAIGAAAGLGWLLTRSGRGRRR